MLRRSTIENKIVLAMVVFVGGASCGCRRDKQTPTPDNDSRKNIAWFEEVAAKVNVNFVHVRHSVKRFYAPEIVSGGVALFDYDRDGDLDIYFVQGGDLVPSSTNKPGNKLYRNRGDGTFEDVTETAGVGDTGYGMGCACGDYDGDGDVDLYVTNVGPNVLYRNNGDGIFTDVTSAAGAGDPSWGTSCAFVDYDSDGNLDIFVANYLNWSPDRELKCRSVGNQRDYCSPNNYQAPARDMLYRNNGNGTFLDLSESAGLQKAFGNGLGVAYGDFDGDGNVDVYVANDAMANQLWLGTGDGRFVDQALLQGCALSGTGAAEAGMGVMAVDIENDGDLDLFLSHLSGESNTLYLNEAGLFDDATAQRGLASPSLAYTGFGLGFADFDHDGNLDLFVANGRVEMQEPTHNPQDPYAEPNLLFQGRDNPPKAGFVEVMPRGGTAQLLIETSRAAAFGDIDNDGDMDIVVVNSGGPVRVLRNVVGSRGQWVMFRVVNRRGSDAIGAAVRVDAGGRKQWRTVQTAYSYCASNDPRVHFGLGSARTIDEVVVRWPGGREETFGPFPAGKLYELFEGTGRSAEGG